MRPVLVSLISSLLLIIRLLEHPEGLEIVLILVVECILERRVVPVTVVPAEVEGGGTGRARGQGLGGEVSGAETRAVWRVVEVGKRGLRGRRVRAGAFLREKT